MSLSSMVSGLFSGNEKRKSDRKETSDTHARIDSKIYTIADLSLTGCRIHPYDGSLIASQTVDFFYLLKMKEGVVTIPVHGRVVRCDSKGLAIKIFEPQPYFRRQLEHFLESDKT